jgi:hypothetical protein
MQKLTRVDTCSILLAANKFVVFDLGPSSDCLNFSYGFALPTPAGLNSRLHVQSTHSMTNNENGYVSPHRQTCPIPHASRSVRLSVHGFFMVTILPTTHVGLSQANTGCRNSRNLFNKFTGLFTLRLGPILPRNLLRRPSGAGNHIPLTNGRPMQIVYSIP